MYLHRHLEKPLQEALRQFPAVLVTGCRQSGKSTLLRHLLPNYTYITLDDMLVRDLAVSDPALFLKTYSHPLLLDEIQYAPNVLPYLKMQIDADRKNYGQYALTGSQVFALMKGVSESLAGRIAIFQLYPLSWKEIPNINLYDVMTVAEQMLKGFYPEFQIQPTLNPKFWHSAYLSTYLEKDLRTLRNIEDLGQFQRYLILLAARAGQLLNLQEIGKECGISQTTAKDWLMLLQATSIVVLLEPYSKNITKRVVKTPKLYFVDTGLLCYLLRIDTPQQLIHSPFGGHIFENMVVMDKIKEFAGKGERAPLYFFRSHAGLEIDLLVDHGDQFDIYEIKFTATPKQDMIQPLLQFRSEHPVRTSALLSLRPEKTHFTKEVVSLHWSESVM